MLLVTLELILERIRFRSGRCSVNPVACYVAVFHQQYIATKQAGNNGHWSKYYEEYQP